MNHGWINFFFIYYPYICVSFLLSGLVFRYVAAPGDWNARSSEIFEQKALRVGSLMFHYAILFSFLGHVAGLLTPDSLLHLLHVPMELHMKVAVLAGKALAPLVVGGIVILLWRRLANAYVRAVSVPTDIAVLALILLNGVTGLYQAYVAQYPVFATIGPWLRGLVVFHPDVSYMLDVPFFMQVHVVSAFTLFALLPFSRLVHIFSVPVTYAVRPFVVYRRRYGDL